MTESWSAEVLHTVILPDWNLKERGISNFAFQYYLGFLGKLNKNNFLNLARDSWDNPIYPQYLLDKHMDRACEMALA